MVIHYEIPVTPLDLAGVFCCRLSRSQWSRVLAVRACGFRTCSWTVKCQSIFTIEWRENSQKIINIPQICCSIRKASSNTTLPPPLYHPKTPRPQRECLHSNGKNRATVCCVWSVFVVVAVVVLAVAIPQQNTRAATSIIAISTSVAAINSTASTAAAAAAAASTTTQEIHIIYGARLQFTPLHADSDDNDRRCWWRQWRCILGGAYNGTA